jgi:hypothetical protein
MADDGVVLAVRPDGVVVDVSQMQDVRRGTKLGFVREDGEREETGQGRVLSIRDGKAQVKLAAKSVVKKGDLAVPCPDPNEDPYTDLRAALAEVQQPAGTGAKGRAKPGRVQTVASEVQAALEARDEAVESGLCDMAPHDSQIVALAEELAEASAPSRSPTARAPSRGSRSAPAENTEEESNKEQESAEQASEADAGSATRPAKGGSAEPQGRGEPNPALGVIGRILEALPGATKQRAESQEAETEDSRTSAPGQQKDSLQGAIDIVSRLTDTLSSKSKLRAKRSEPAAGEDSRTPRQEAGQPEATAPSDEASAPSELPTSADPPSSEGAPAGSSSASDSEGSTPPKAGTGASAAGKRLPSSLDRILRDRTAKATPPEEGRPSAKSPATRRESRDAKSVTVAGQVIDSKGRPLAGARVALGDLATTTDKDGRFGLANVKPGRYDVTVSATGFGPVKRTLSVRPGSRPLGFTLRAAPAAKEGKPTTSLKRPRKFGEVDE